MRNSMVVFTFFVSYRKHSFWKTKINEARLLSLRPYGSRDFEIGSCRQHLFCCCECACELFFCTTLKIFNNLKLKQTFIWHESIFCLKNYKLIEQLFYVTWINILLMKHKLINFDWIVNKLIVLNLFINDLSLKELRS